ncbi:MAG: hypothetical protein GTN53_35360, partial [Candidatus Aminicenantes bacterium]|nr:hypothetical protein [Candidatus Aminicenantes bacterium]NIQ71760.1 hypothetical protein [Candidatus Aminicenantes bacterium]NIT27794.1 hypothetical protein [Candidatus Aminicenantes bacterium]
VKDGRYVKENDRIYNPLLKNFLQEIADNGIDIYSGEVAKKFVKKMGEKNGLVT